MSMPELFASGWQVILHLKHFLDIPGAEHIDISEDVPHDFVSSITETVALEDFRTEVGDITLKLTDEYGLNHLGYTTYYRILKRVDNVYVDVYYDGHRVFRGYHSKDRLRRTQDGAFFDTEFSFTALIYSLDKKIINYRGATLKELQSIASYMLNKTTSSNRLYNVNIVSIDPEKIITKIDYDKTYLQNIPEYSPNGWLIMGHEMIAYARFEYKQELVNNVTEDRVYFYPHPGSSYNPLAAVTDRKQRGTAQEIKNTTQGAIIKALPYTDVITDFDIDVDNILDATFTYKGMTSYSKLATWGYYVANEAELYQSFAWAMDVKKFTLYKLPDFNVLPTDPIQETLKLPASLSAVKWTSGSSLLDGSYLASFGYPIAMNSGPWTIPCAPMDVTRRPLCITIGRIASVDRYIVMLRDPTDKVGLVRGVPFAPSYLETARRLKWYVLLTLGAVVENKVDGTNQQSNLMYIDPALDDIIDLSFVEPVPANTGQQQIVYLALHRDGSLSLRKSYVNVSTVTHVADIPAEDTTVVWTHDANAESLISMNGYLQTVDVNDTNVQVCKKSFMDSEKVIRTVSFKTAQDNYARCDESNDDTFQQMLPTDKYVIGFNSVYYLRDSGVVVTPPEMWTLEWMLWQDRGLTGLITKRQYAYDILNIDINNKSAFEVLNNFRKFHIAFMALGEDNVLRIQSLKKIFEAYENGSETPIVLNPERTSVVSTRAFSVDMVTIDDDDFLKNDRIKEIYTKNKVDAFSDYTEFVKLSTDDTYIDYHKFVDHGGRIGIVLDRELVNHGDGLVSYIYDTIMQKEADIVGDFEYL